MKKHILAVLMASAIFFGTTVDLGAATTRHRTRRQAIRHRRHVQTAKRVGVGAAGGAAIGALAGGGNGAAIGAGAGAGAGALYDQHEKHKGKN